MLSFTSKFVPKSGLVRSYGSAKGASGEFDIVVAGHGLVGGALAVAVAGSRLGSHLKVAVIDRSVPAPIDPQRSMDTRAISVAPSTSDFLRDIGVWDDISAHGVTPFHHMKVWDSRGLGQVSFSNTDAGLPQMGHIVENNVISRALWDKMSQMKNISLISDSEIKAITPKFHDSTRNGSAGYPDFLEVQLSNGSSINCKTIVGADGANSTVRNLVGFPQYTYDYDRTAVAGTVLVDRNHSTAWQRFLADGPIALLPGPNNYSSIVWSTTPTKAKEFMQLTPEARVVELNRLLSSPPDLTSEKFAREDDDSHAAERFAQTQKLTHEQKYVGSMLMPSTGSTLIAPSYLTRFTRTVENVTAYLARGTQPAPPTVTGIPGALASFPLRLTHSNTYFRNRAVLIGDAAHTVHPLAGQGANMGFSDAQVLAEGFLRAAYSGIDLGSVTVLHEYEGARHLSNKTFQTAIDTLQHGFDSDIVPVKYARNLGMALFNSAPFVKQMVVAYASGNLGYPSGPHVRDRVY